METLYILRYTLQGFELKKQEILPENNTKSLPFENGDYVISPNSDYITYFLDNGRTNIVRKTKLNKITTFGDFSFVAYFSDPKQYPHLKAEMCDKIDLSILKQEQILNRSKNQYKEFLYSKLGEQL